MALQDPASVRKAVMVPHALNRSEYLCCMGPVESCKFTVVFFRTMLINLKGHPIGFFDNTSLCIGYLVESCKITLFLFGSILPNLKGH